MGFGPPTSIQRDPRNTARCSFEGLWQPPKVGAPFVSVQETPNEVPVQPHLVLPAKTSHLLATGAAMAVLRVASSKVGMVFNGYFGFGSLDSNLLVETVGFPFDSQ